MQVDDFLQALVNFDKEHIPEATVRCVREEHLSDPEFNPDFVRQKSSAAAGLCAWVINIIRFHEVQQLPQFVTVISVCAFFLTSTLLLLFDQVFILSTTLALPWTDFCKYNPAVKT